MKFLYKKYQAKRKEILRVELDMSTKVKFMTAGEFKMYEKGKSHTFFGGTFDSGEVHFVLPFDSVWYTVVERGSYHEPLELSATCSLLPPDSAQLSTIALDAPEDVRHAIENGVSEEIGEIADDLSDAVEDVVEKGEDLLDGE